MNAEFIPDEHFQFGALSVLDLLSQLVEESPRKVWTKEEVVELLQKAKTVEELFEPEVVAAYEMTIKGLQIPEGAVS